MASGAFKNIAVVVQCRLSSTRLPQKALKILGGSECLCWTLNAMKKVKAARYFLACDYDSKSALEPLAQKCGWEIFAGDRDDVLGRFCALLESQFPECDLVVRATGDNPFLFWEAAALSTAVFEQKYFEADYFTFSGLPHGSGVELFKAASILKARQSAQDDYDREHVGPALYRYPNLYKCVFEKAPAEFFAPDLRTTIDTFADFKRAQRLCAFFEKGGQNPPYSAPQILSALKEPLFQKTLLLVPSVKAGRGTGHLRRALGLAKDLRAFVCVPQDASLKEAGSLVQEALRAGLGEWQIVREPYENLRGGWDLVVLDLFCQTKREAELFAKLGPVCSIDDGGAFCADSDYLLDIIPSMPRKRRPSLAANWQNPALIELPKNRRAEFPKEIKTALVCVSGETRGQFSAKAVRALQALGVKTTEVSSKNPVANLRERLCQYDLVVAHYGFTAFEALAANCAVVLLATSALHKKLSKKYGFACLAQNDLSPKKLRALLQKPAALQNERFKAALEGRADLGLASDCVQGADAFAAKTLGLSNDSVAGTFGLASDSLAPLSKAVQELLSAQKFLCPLCGAKKIARPSAVVARTKSHTFRRCPSCGMLYLSYSTDSRVQYEADYFGREYKAQYGRDYLQDFDSIKAQGARRVKNILTAPIFRLASSSSSATILDIGCAYGPFLAAANEAGFEPFGTDISQSALSYVKDKLGFKCVLSSFADFDAQKTFGVKQFDAVAMWYVIEHCRDLDALLRRANALLKNGGVLAFSTPNASGLSGRFNKKKFFEQSPRDHYTLWEAGRAAKFLRRYGFKAYKTVQTGLHPERAKIFKNLAKKPFIFAALSLFCKLFALGDTFEIYCVKVGEAR